MGKLVLWPILFRLWLNIDILLALERMMMFMVDHSVNKEAIITSA